MDAEGWDKILRTNGLNPIEIRDNRYNQVIHMVSILENLMRRRIFQIVL